jgi:hypothetical protein
MTRMIRQADMPYLDLFRCATDVFALLDLCREAAESIESNSDEAAVNRLADNIKQVTRLASELLEPVLEALETHEGMKRGAS